MSDNRYPPITFLELLKRQVPSLFKPFKPAWWLPGKHCQTVYCSLGDFAHVDPICYDRWRIIIIMTGLFTVDITPPISERPLSDGEPVLIVLHGLTGGSHESYVRAVLAAVTPQREEGGLGMRGMVMNFRGCAGSPLLTKKLYHAGSTEDLRALILWLSDILPHSSYYAAGFSLGSNVLVKYCGEEGDACPLTAAISLANIWDYYKAGRHIENGTFINRYVYDLVLGDALRNLIRVNLQAFKDETRFSVPDLLSRRLVRMRYYCDVVNSHLGGFKDADDYYVQESSFQYIGRVRIPLLAINARDDPISCEINLPVAEVESNPWVIMATTGGGHMGWFEAGAKRWYVTPAKEFLRAFMKACQSNMFINVTYPHPLPA
ncbi:AB-hydrolase YheT [Hysterangium stoloniferum]|nr:AB-hydrolase YheT [Hysterangium stoloniferum]